MKLQQKVSLYIVALIVLASFATSTFASCPTMRPGPPCQEFWRADAVFIGTATRVVRVPNETQLLIGPYVRSTTHFSVDETFKGVEGTVVILEADHCGQLFQEGERYLVYAYHNSYAKKLEVRAGSTRTRLLSEANEDLAYIRGLPSAEAGARIFGKVVRQTHNLKEGKFDVAALKDIRITLETNDEQREAKTDSEGRYEFRRVPTGSYRLRAEVASSLSLEEQKVNVTNRACMPVDLFALSKAQIAGRVLDLDGKPVNNVSVTLVSADAKPEQILSQGKNSVPTSTGYSGPDGTYRFPQLAPGRYLLIVNHDDFRMASSPESARVLPRLFYPGVSDLKAATVIVLADDQKPQAYDFVLPIQQ
jgi:protocatechuate 3,4-dioxygenase beta subunit